MSKPVALRYTFADLAAAAEAIDFIERMKADLAEFAAEYLPGDDGVIEFLEIATGDAFTVPPTEAIGYFTAKGLQTSFSYTDMIGRANDHAFTVAKMMDVDLLSQVRASLDSALANGTSFGEWKRGIVPILQSAGWWGEADMVDPLTGQTVKAQLGSAWRLETIFRTNMQTAYAAGQWRQIQEQAQFAPFLMYDAVDDFRTRPAHRAWDSTVLPVTSPWWKTHYPPCGWNCRCGVIQLDEEQVASMGITPRAEPPDDGSYTWTNPRTGERMQVPNGIDPGFDRNPGDVVNADLRQLLREKVATLPQDMQEAVAPVLRREFDTTTVAGQWHAVSFDQAPDWMREKALDQQSVSVEFKSSGAYARSGFLIDMDGEKIDRPDGQSVWRHEFGHILDSRSATTELYRSAQADFVKVQKADADELAAAAGNGRKSKANDAKRAAVVQAYEDARTRMIDTEHDDREGALRDMATAAGMDFDAFLTVVRDSTRILEGGVSIGGVGIAVRLARMIEAVRLGDGEGFIRWASYKDTVEDMLKARQYDKGVVAEMSQSFRKDGSLSSLSDLIGSATRNRAANFHDGFPGHSNSYYRKASFYPTTESFANLTSMAAHPNPYWWEITKRFAPRMADLFRLIIEGKA
jgi:SPP1 gp7 family putative phage head morphogenesis protein